MDIFDPAINDNSKRVIHECSDVEGALASIESDSLHQNSISIDVPIDSSTSEVLNGAIGSTMQALDYHNQSTQRSKSTFVQIDESDDSIDLISPTNIIHTLSLSGKDEVVQEKHRYLLRQLNRSDLILLSRLLHSLKNKRKSLSTSDRLIFEGKLYFCVLMKEHRNLFGLYFY